MFVLLDQPARLYRMMLDGYAGPARPPVYNGTAKECTAIIPERYADQRYAFFVELDSGSRLSGHELKRFAAAAGNATESRNSFPF